MKNLLRTLLVIALFGAALPSFADESSDTPRQSMELKIQDLKDRLALTPDQEQKLAPLIEDRNAKLRDLFARSSPDSSRADKRALFREARSIQEDFNDKLKPILTAEQMKQWEAFRKEARSEARERYRNRAN